MKKILILGAGEGQLPLIRRARAKGLFTLVASPYGDYPGFALASGCCYVDIANKERVLQIAIDSRIDAIATDQTDIAVSSVYYVAEYMGLPHISCCNIDHFRYKYLMREICQSEGLPTIPFCVVSVPQDAIAFYHTLRFPTVIVKPVDSQGSRGVVRVGSETDLIRAVSEALKYSMIKKVIVEQFIDGRELEVDTVVKDGSVIFTLIGDVHNFSRENSFSSYERIYPTAVPKDIESRILRINERTIQVLGLTKGWTHGEYILSNDGEVFLLEIGARGGGNFIGSEIVRAFCGFGTDEMALLTSLGDDSFYNKITKRDTYCAYKCFFLPEGIVHSIAIDYGFLRRKSILKHNLDSIFVGKKINRNMDKTSRYTIVVQASSRFELRALLDEICNKVSVRVMTEFGIENAIWQ